jgi:hypothetical protein
MSIVRATAGVLICISWALPTGPVAAGECAQASAHPEWKFCDDFESGSLSKWTDVTSVTVSTQTANAHDGSHSVDLFYRTGSTGAGWMWKKGLRADSSGQDSQFVRWWQKWQTGFAFADGDDQKVWLLEGLQPQDEWDQTANWKVYVHFIGDTTVSGVAREELYLDSFVHSGPGQWDGQWSGLRQNRTVSRYTTNTWHCTEIEIKHNTPGNANGTVRMWVNDSLALEHANVKLRDDAVSWNALMLNGWYDTGSGVPRDQHSWIDQVVVSSSRIGCGSSPVVPSPPQNLQAQ